MNRYERENRHRGHIKLIDKSGALRCAKDGVVVAKKPRVVDEDDRHMIRPAVLDPDVTYIDPSDVLFSPRKPKGFRKLFDDDEE